MNVEIIDDRHQRFNGTVYNKNFHGYYMYKKRRLHRDVWEYHNGKIPDGYVIHHVDGDKSNNDISNLQMLTQSEHAKLHYPDVPRNTFVCAYCGKVYKTVEHGNNRFCSKKCLNDYHYRNGEVTKICEWCGNEFVTRWRRARFCSKSCGNFARWEGHSPLQKICPVCGKEFTTQLSNDAKTCSRSCANKLYWQNRHENHSAD